MKIHYILTVLTSLIVIVPTSACSKKADKGRIDWVSIKGGTFQQGISLEEFHHQLERKDITLAIRNQLPRELPSHEVKVSDFEISRTEVTVGQYMDCVSDGGCIKPKAEPHCSFTRPDSDDLPMTCVKYSDAEKFCAWAKGRVPTESEWEYAAKNQGEAVRYPWGNETEPNCDLAVIDTKGRGCDRRSVWPVCSMKAGNTKQGLCDMAGNVWEWTTGTLIAYPNFDQKILSDLQLQESEVFDPNRRILRGGGISSFKDYRTTVRTGHNSTFQYGGAGIRCVR